MRPISKLVLLLTAVAAVAALVSVPLSGASDARGANAFVLPKLRTVTLITGDVVHVATRRDGKRSVSLQPGADGTIPTASITEAGRHLYVVPQAAIRLLAAKRLDLDLFDVAGLVEQRYDDAHRQTLPVIVDYGRGAPAAAKARSATLRHATKTHALPIFGASAFSADKRQARGFWRSLTASPDRTGAPTALAGGATRVDLDGRVHAVLDHSVPQIHAPEAWAAGYDGAGSKVAVLDTGIDATHPDLAGQVSTTANFSTEDSVVDGNGHGTHVASTIAGTGAASSGLRKGVAPGARLLVGKVLGNNGSGEDSWVMAGMQWAASSGADVVNMSLGGDIGDGTDPLSQAINDLSASTATLFVVAAGNNGSDASTVTAPGAARAALTVGAVDDNDALAWFSSRGPLVGGAGVKPDVVAPGVDITAARAAGTSLGNPVDDYYTDLSGTSMATPHVSGVAAILKEEHPAWDGERLKEAITASAVPIAGASAYEAGTGRVDALRAIHQTVISDDSLDLGYYPYPQSALSPTHTALGYTNLGSAPVTLHLAVASEDGSAGLSGISVSPSELTIPAGGQASADVTVDPAQVGTGSVSGVIDAQADGGVDVRTAFGLVLESEHYNLTVQVDPRRGTQHATHTIGLLGLDTFTYDQREITGQGPQSVTFRVVPGTYAVGGITFGLAADGASEGVLSYQPSVDVHSNQTVVLDGNAARQFRYRTDRPVVSNGQIMTVTWNGAAGFAGFTLAGAVDRLYAQPLDASSGGEVESQLNWMLSQPDAELASPRGPVSLRALTAPGGRAWSVPGAAGLFRLVDAGSSANLRTQGVKQAVAVVSGACDDLTAAVSSLKGAGAVAVIAYAGPGADCAGSLTATPPLPVYQATPADAARLLSSAGRSAWLQPHASPQYVYDLLGAWDGSVPAGATVDGTSRSVAALVERYDTLGEDTRQGHDVWEMPLGWAPGRDSTAFGLVRPVALPGVVTHYVSAIADWERGVEVHDANGFPEGMLWAPREHVAAAKAYRDRWFGGPLTSNVSPVVAQFGWQGSPYRQGDFLWMYMPTLVDDAGHEGSPIYLGEFEGELYQDGELVLQADDPIWMQTVVPPERHDYKLVYTTHRQNGFWQRSTTTTTAWTFASAQPADDHEDLPLTTVDYDLPLSVRSTAPAGMYAFGVHFGMPPGVATARLRKVRVEISWDGGGSWADAALRGCSLRPGGGCTALVRNRRSGVATLRVSEGDAAGRTVTQTIVDAYAVS